MTNKLSDTEHQASLDRNFPFIERDSEPPGRWVSDPLGKKWDGQTHWSTRHGDAVVRWSLGEPCRIDFALYPDRTRGVVQKNGYGRWRRLAVNARNWIHGTIQIKADDVTFSDGEQPIYKRLRELRSQISRPIWLTTQNSLKRFRMTVSLMRPMRF